MPDDEKFAAVENKIADMVEHVRKNREEMESREKAKADLAGKREGKRTIQTEIVLIAASTGGPPVLRKILSALEGDFAAPILVVQHMLPDFPAVMAQDLNKHARLLVKVAKEGEKALAGTVYIAPSGAHMTLDGDKKIQFDLSPPIAGIRPAADILFESVARARSWRGVVAVILTGMGSDGKRGLIALKAKQNCFCLAQSEQSCAVYGMPRAAAESGLVDKALDPDAIIRELQKCGSYLTQGAKD